MALAHTIDVSIVIPTLREAENIGILLEQLRKNLDWAGRSWEVIVADDDSNDGTDAICDWFRGQGMALTLIVRKTGHGLAAAVLDGFAVSKGRILVVMDADLSHPVASVPALVEAIEGGAEMAIGSRYIAGGGTDDRWTLFRYLNSMTATLLARGLVKLSDPMSGFFAVQRKLWKRCEALSPLGYKIALELLVKGGAEDIREIPIRFQTRQYGRSKLTIRQQWLYLRHIGRLYRHKYARY